MKIATVFDNSDPVSMIRKHNGMISVDNRKVITSALSFCLTKAPMTPREVNRKYSKGLVFDVVLRNGYRKSGMWAGNRERWRRSVQKSFCMNICLRFEDDSPPKNRPLVSP